MNVPHQHQQLTQAQRGEVEPDKMRQQHLSCAEGVG